MVVTIILGSPGNCAGIRNHSVSNIPSININLLYCLHNSRKVTHANQKLAVKLYNLNTSVISNISIKLVLKINIALPKQ